MTLLTIVTVVKDDDRGLASTLESIAAQGQGDEIEVVVIDGSHDHNAAARIVDGRPGVRSSWAAPQGIYPAMNSGLAQATGDYVYYLNAGDTFADDTVLARVLPLLRAHTPMWAFGRVRFLTESGQPMPEPDWDYAEEQGHAFARGRFPAHQGVIMSTRVLRGLGGFDTRYRVAADYARILSFSRLGAPLQLGLTLAEFRQGGLSTQRWFLAQKEFHLARRRELRPSGTASLEEFARTGQGIAATAVYRTLWAEGRPLHRAVASLRSR